MPSKRRGGFGPPELRGTLGTLLRTTTGVVRDALERGAREGRARLDDARASRRRNDTLAELGELVLDLIRRGEIDLAELPEARDLIRQLDELDAEPVDDPPAPPPRTSSRRRYDDRARDDRPRDDRPRDDRPRDDRPRDDRPRDDRPRDDRPRDDRSRSNPGRPGSGASAPASGASPAASDDGTVSSGLTDRPMRPTLPARPKHADSSPSSRATAKPMKGFYRSRLTDDDPSPSSSSAPTRPPAATRGAAAIATADTPAPRRSPLPLDPNRKGGISFDDDDDDDLDDYMHPDDVPPKTPHKPTDPEDGDA